MAKPPALQAGKDGSEPSGVTARWTGVRFQPGLISPVTRVQIPPAPPISRGPTKAGRRTVNPYGEGSNPSARAQHIMVLQGSRLAGSRSPRHPVKVETAGSNPVRTAQDRSRSRGETDITPGYEPGERGFDSLRERASPASSTEERLPYKRRIGVRVLGWVLWPIPKSTRSQVVTLVQEGGSPSGHPRVGGAAATALGRKPSIPPAGSSPARPTHALVAQGIAH